MRRPRLWLFLALALFALSAWLMWLGDEKKPARARPRHEAWEFPAHQTSEAFRREQRRLVPFAAKGVDAGAAQPRDPLLLALVPRSKNSIVLEVGAIRDAPLGKIILDCAFPADARASVDGLKRSSGLDFLRDVDRVAVSDETVFATGDFRAVKWSEVSRGEPRPYGGRGLVYPGATGGAASQALGTWGTNLVITGSAAEVERAMDRLDGRADPEPMPIEPSETYGEAYGRFSGDVLSALVPDAVQNEVREYAKNVSLHVDARGADDVLVVADVSGPHAARVEDLGKSLGAALSVARLAAEREGDEGFRELLDLSRVQPEKGNFRLEAAVPLDLVRRKLCARRDAK